MFRIRSNRLLNRVTTVPVMTLAAVSWWQIARADAVLDWNAIAVDTISTASPPRPGPVGFLDMAVVQAAVYDAVQAIDGKFKPYHVQIPGASGSPEAAAAKAAHDVLVNIFPAQGGIPRHRLPRLSGQERLGRETIPGWRWARRPLPVSSPCGLMTGVCRTRCRPPSPATMPSACGARRPPTSPRRRRPARLWRRRGWVPFPVSHCKAETSSAPNRHRL